MTKIRADIGRSYPTIVIELTPDGLKVSLEGWQHNAPVALLSQLEPFVHRAIHQWRSRFVARLTHFGTPNLREQDLNEEQRSRR